MSHYERVTTKDCWSFAVLARSRAAIAGYNDDTESRIAYFQHDSTRLNKLQSAKVIALPLLASRCLPYLARPPISSTEFESSPVRQQAFSPVLLCSQFNRISRCFGDHDRPFLFSFILSTSTIHQQRDFSLYLLKLGHNRHRVRYSLISSNENVVQ